MKSILATTVLIAAIGPAAAAELPKEGKYDFSDCSVATGVYGIEFSKTNSASSYELVGTNRSNPPGGLFDLTSFRCVGLNTTIDVKQSATGVCEVLDKDGDKILMRYDTDAQGKINESAIAGTGKYEGIISRSTTTEVTQAPLAKPGSFQICLHETGTYKLGYLLSGEAFHHRCA